MPVVAMHDVRRPRQALAGLQYRAAQHRETQRLIAVAGVEAVAIVELGASDEMHSHVALWQRRGDDRAANRAIRKADVERLRAG